MYKLLHYWSEVFSLERLANIGRQIAQVGNDTRTHHPMCCQGKNCRANLCIAIIIIASFLHVHVFFYFLLIMLNTV